MSSVNPIEFHSPLTSTKSLSPSWALATEVQAVPGSGSNIAHVTPITGYGWDDSTGASAGWWYIIYARYIRIVATPAASTVYRVYARINSADAEVEITTSPVTAAAGVSTELFKGSVDDYAQLRIMRRASGVAATTDRIAFLHRGW